MKTVVAVVAGALALAPGRASADYDNPFPDSVVISPGVKLGYTFGEGGGWTYGAELTVLWRTGADLSAIVAHGPALNVYWTRGGTFQLRPGWQVVSWFAGIEAGPALIRRRGSTRLGLGVTPWIGAFVVPHYTYTFVPAEPAITELGVYLKLPLCTGCEGGDGFDFDDDD